MHVVPWCDEAKWTLTYRFRILHARGTLSDETRQKQEQSTNGCVCITCHAGSNADLRKLQNNEAAKILLDFGISQEIVNGLTDR